MVHQKVRNSFYTWNHQRGPDWWFLLRPDLATCKSDYVVETFKRFFHEDYELGTCFVDASQSAILQSCRTAVRGNEVRHHGSWGEIWHFGGSQPGSAGVKRIFRDMLHWSIWSDVGVVVRARLSWRSLEITRFDSSRWNTARIWSRTWVFLAEPGDIKIALYVKIVYPTYLIDLLIFFDCWPLCVCVVNCSCPFVPSPYMSPHGTSVNCCSVHGWYCFPHFPPTRPVIANKAALAVQLRWQTWRNHGAIPCASPWFSPFRASTWFKMYIHIEFYSPWL